MIRLHDAYVLASTKLRTRRIRTILAVISAGLIFGVIILASLLLTGLQNSLSSYARAGFGGRYFLSLSDYSAFSQSVFEATDKRAQSIATERIKSLKTQAKSPAQIEAVASAVRNPISSDLDREQATHEIQPPVTNDQVSKKLSGLPIKGVYEGRTLGVFGFLGFHIVQGGKELGTITTKDNMGPSSYGGSVKSPLIQALDKDLLTPFVTAGQSLNDTNDPRVPVLVPLDYALDLTSTIIPKTIPIKDSIALKQAAQKKLVGQNLTLCFRNRAALDQYGEAAAQAEDLEKNGKSKDYVKPDVQLTIPPGACLPVAVTRDTRTPEQKADMDFQRRLEGKELPQTQLVQTRIVGFVSPAPSFNDALGLSALFTSGPFGSLYLPLEATHAPGPIDALFNRFPSSSTVVHYVEAASVTDYRTILKKSCTFTADPTAAADSCAKDGRYYVMQNYGNPSVGLQDAFGTIARVGLTIILIMLGVAVVIMMTTIGKIMADSRRETGVFRAIGARRLDIASIYLLYASLLALRSFVIALVLATGVSLVLTSAYGPELTAKAIDAFGTYTDYHPVTLIGFSWWQLLAILGITQVAALVASLLPIANNVGRNPIKALRDEA